MAELLEPSNDTEDGTRVRMADGVFSIRRALLRMVALTIALSPSLLAGQSTVLDRRGSDGLRWKKTRRTLCV